MPSLISQGPEPRTADAPSADAPFVRLWQAFMAGRIVVALALLLLQAIGQTISLHFDPWVLAVCLGYLAASVVLRAMAHQHPPAPQVGIHWLPSVGVDIATFAAVQLLHTGTMNYTPLFGLPILMASVLGALPMALGTTACVTLLLLAWAWWAGQHGGGSQHYLQAALTSTGYFIVAYLVQQLAWRLHSEQKVAQQSLMAARVQAQVSALVVQNLSDGVLVVDEADTVHIANPAARELLGQAPTAAPPFSLEQSPHLRPLADMARASFRQGLPQTADVALQPAGLSPTELHVRTWLTSTPHAHPAAPSMRLCVMFLHDLRELEAKLRTEKMAAMGRMSAAVAHELRNPLAAIMQANALLSEDLTEPAQKRLSGMVHQNAERLARIAEEVLDIARVKNPASHTPAHPLPLDSAVARIWNDWQSQDPVRRRATLTLAAPKAQVAFDGEHLRRTLFNLLDNALRYAGNEADSLQISTQSRVPGRIELQVWSDGAPMEKSVERHLFEPFFSSESRSSGLGLYICRELCERHGATIGYQRLTRPTARGPTGGNAFTIFLDEVAPAAQPGTLFDTLAA